MGAILASNWLMLSRTDEPFGTWIPGGKFARNGSESDARPPGGRHCERGSEGPGKPPSKSSPLTVVLPSRKGSESARSIRSGRPPTSVLLRFRTAEVAVSWSRGQVDRMRERERVIFLRSDEVHVQATKNRLMYPRIHKNHNLWVFLCPCRILVYVEWHHQFSQNG